MTAGPRYTSHVDRFLLDRMPPAELAPSLRFDLLGRAYPERLNCAVELLDGRDCERPCLTDDHGSWTARQLLDRVNQVGNVLREELDVVPGTRVLLHGFNGAALVTAWLAIVKAGAVAIATMPRLRARELGQIAERANAAVALCDARLERELAAVARGGGPLRRVVAWSVGGDGELDRLATRHATAFEATDTAAADPCIVAFTSGTTGAPKGAVHTHRDVLACCDSVMPAVFAPGPDDVFAGTPALAFTFGLLALVCYPLRAGARTVLRERGTAATLLETVERERATISVTAPTTYRSWLSALPHSDVSSLRLAVSSGEPLPRWLSARFAELTGVEITNCFGSTEMLHSFLSTAGLAVRRGSLGKPVPGYAVAVLDEHGREVETGAVGLLAVQGPTGCLYLDDERQREHVIDGWTITGDRASRDAEGYFWHHGRRDDLIVSAGYKISPAEVEEVLSEHPAVADCGVVGRPDPDRGAVAVAYVVLSPGHPADTTTEADLQEFLQSRLAKYKCPRTFIFVGALSRTASGKLHRHALAALDEPQPL